MMYNQRSRSPARKAGIKYAIGGLLALVVPFALMSTIMIVIGKHIPGGPPPKIELPFYVWLGLMILPGILGVEILPIKRIAKGLLLACYLPLMTVALIFYSLWSACTFHSECL